MQINEQTDKTVITIQPPARGWLQKLVGIVVLPIWVLGSIEFVKALVETPDLVAGGILLGLWILPFGWHLFRSLVPLRPETLTLSPGGLEVDFGIGPFSMLDAVYLKAVKHYWRDYFLAGRYLDYAPEIAGKIQLVDLGGSVTLVLDDNGKEKHFARYAMADEKRQIIDMIRRQFPQESD